MAKISRKLDQGFTLVELMIVVAIIGILAAIAIPQFAAYRIRGFNSSTLSDVRNIATSQAALFSDWQRFGYSQNNTAMPGSGGSAAGEVCQGPSGPTTLITTNDATGGFRGLNIGIGNRVMLIANDTANMASFTTTAKHILGDTFYSTDSDTTAFYLRVIAASAGNNLAAGNSIAPTDNVDNFATAAAIAANWVPK